MATIDPDSLIAELNAGKLRWRQIIRSKRCAIISHLLNKLAEDHEVMSIATFQRLTPDWLPKNGRYIATPFRCDWRTLVERHGMKIDA